MKQSFIRWSMASLVLAGLTACGGGGGGSTITIDPPAGAVAAALASASTVATNDTATNSSASFTVLQNAGVPAVTINSPPVVNFAVFSGGKVLSASVKARFAIAKLVPGTDGDPDQWVNYIYKDVSAKAATGPGGVPATTGTVKQASTDPASSISLSPNAEGYYSYTFSKDITTGVAPYNYQPDLTHRIAIQLSYQDAAGETVNVNPYFDFTVVAGKSVAVTDPAKTRKMTDVASCNGCHEKLALHGPGRVDTQYCVMCHNPGTTDPESGNNLNLSTMVHKLHAGKRLKAAGEDYTIWGYNDKAYSYAEVGFPQDLRNCTVCHSGANPKTPQGDNWKTKPSQEACLTCHASGTGSPWELSHTPIAVSVLKISTAKAADMANQYCAGCHIGDPTISSERVHWNQNEENAAKYKMTIESAVFNDTPDHTGRSVTVQYYLADTTNGNATHDLTKTEFSNLKLYLAYQNLAGQSTAVTEYSSGSGASVAASSGTLVPGTTNHYTATIVLPDDVSGKTKAVGTARVVSAGRVTEPRIDVQTRTPVAGTVNVVAQHTYKDVVLSGTLSPRRVIVSNEKCNVCHGALGTTTGSNTGKANAFHRGDRTMVEACVVCHDANLVSTSSLMTDGSSFNESYQFKRMIHGIHGNSKRFYPFTRKNAVQGAFCNPANTSAAAKAACNASLTLASTVSNFAAEVAWPGVGINCNACHVDNSYKQDLGTLGSVIRIDSGVTDPNGWKVISPKAATCTACHDSGAAIGHVTTWGGATYGNKTQAEIATFPGETCDNCHSPGNSTRPVDLVHGQK